MSTEHRRLLLDMFQAAVNAAAPAMCVPAHLPPRPKGRTIVVGGREGSSRDGSGRGSSLGRPFGAGWSSHAMATQCRASYIEVIEAWHPVPDASRRPCRTRGCSTLVCGAIPDDLVMVLFSGGGSALLTLHPGRISSRELQDLNTQLFNSGRGDRRDKLRAPSYQRPGRRPVGGRLLSRYVVCLSISDVPGDDPVNIASGPTGCRSHDLRRCARRAPAVCRSNSRCR